jgi:hypothetical protein
VLATRSSTISSPSASFYLFGILFVFHNNGYPHPWWWCCRLEFCSSFDQIRSKRCNTQNSDLRTKTYSGHYRRSGLVCPKLYLTNTILLNSCVVNLTPNALRLLDRLGALEIIRDRNYGDTIDFLEVFDVYSGKLAESSFRGPDGKGLGDPPYKVNCFSARLF